MPDNLKPAVARNYASSLCFALEALENRVLLSADPALAGVALPLASAVDDAQVLTEIMPDDALQDRASDLFDGVTMQGLPLESPAAAQADLSSDAMGVEIAAAHEELLAPLETEILTATYPMPSPLTDPAPQGTDGLTEAARGPPVSLTGEPSSSLTDIVLAADAYTNGDTKLFDGNVILAAGKDITVSTGPLGGNIFIEGKLDGTNDPGNLTESLTIIAGTGDLYIRGDIGSAVPLQNLTIVSAGRVVLNGSIQVAGLLRILNSTGTIDLGLPLVEGGSAGNVTAGAVEISTDAQIIFAGALVTTGPAQSITLAARPVSGTGDITITGNLTTDGPLQILQANQVRFSGVVSVAGAMTQTSGSGVTRFDRNMAAQSLDLTTNALVFNDRVSVHSGFHLTLTADEIDFNGGLNTVTSAGTDTSNLVLRPLNSSVPIKLGTAAGANVGVLDLSNNDLAAISDKFGSVKIGWEGSADTVTALQRKAMTVVTSGGSTLTAATVEIRSPGLNNDLRFTAQTAGTAMNDVVVLIFDDDTMTAGAAAARYYAATKLLAINVNLFETPASAVMTAVNQHTKDGDTTNEFTAATRPFTVTAGADFTTGAGQFETVISAKTTQGATSVAATAILVIPGADNDIRFTATALDLTGNGATIALLNRDVTAATVQYDSGGKRLVIQARLTDGPNGIAHTRAQIIAAINQAGVAFLAAEAPADSGAAGELELGRAEFNNPAEFHAASLRLINNVTGPQSIIMSAWAGGITTPISGAILTASLSLAASGPIQLNTSVDSLIAAALANGDITIGDANDLIVTTASAVNGSIYLVTAEGNLTMAAGGGLTAGGVGNVAVRAANSVIQNANVIAAGSSISVHAVGSAITMASTVNTFSNGGNIRYAAGAGIALGQLNAGTGRISLVAATGGIADQNGPSLNLQASQIRLEAGSAMGAAGDALEIAATTLAGTAATGIFLGETDNLTIGAVSVSLTIVNSNLSTSVQTDAQLVGLSTLIGGAIVLESAVGSLSVDQPVLADAAGNIRLAALAAGQDLVINAAVSSGSGNLSLLAGRNFTQNANGAVATTGGTVDVQAGTGAILMQDGALTSSAGGHIRYAAGTDVTLGGLNAGAGGISVTAAAGSILDGGDSQAEATAAQLRLRAGLAVAANSNHLELAVNVLAAQAGASGIYLMNATPVIVDSVGPITVNRVGADGTAPAAQQQTDAVLSDLIAVTGNIVLATSNGSVTINSGPVSGGIAAGGHLLLQAQGPDADVILNGAVSTSTGHLSLVASRSIVLAADGDIAVTSGDLVVLAQSGALTMSDGALAQISGNIRAEAATDIAVGGLSTTTGEISVIAGGVIFDNGDAHVDISATRVRLVAGTAIGNGANLLDTQVNELAASAGGSIYLSEADALILGTVGQVVAQRIQINGTPASVQDNALLSGVLTNAANGRVIVVTVNGSLTVNQPVSAHGSGNVLLQAQSTGAADKDVVLSQSVASASGRISVVANRSVLQAATASILTGGVGTIDVEAENGAIAMANGALTQTVGGALRYAARGNVTLGGLDAGAGDISVISATGSILDGGDTHKDLLAGRVRMAAAVAVGQAANPLETTATTIAVRADGGGIFLLEDDAIAIGLVGPVFSYRVRNSGTSTLLTDAALSGLTTTNANGSIVVRTVAGSLSSQQTVTANGSGNILLHAQGSDADITLDAPVVAATGHITLLAARDISQLSAGDITNPGGTVDVEAFAGAIIMSDGALTQTNSYPIRYTAATDITLGGLQSTSGTVTLEAGRAILDGGDTHGDVAAPAVRISAGAGVGLPGDALDLSVSTLAARAGDAMFLVEADALAVGSVAGVQIQRVAADATAALFPLTVPGPLAGLTTTGGDFAIVLITINGSLSINSPVAASGAGNVLLQTQSVVVNDKDLVLEAAISSNSGNLSIVGNRNVNQLVGGNLNTSGTGTITVEAQNGSIIMTDSGAASAATTTAGGNIRYRAAQSIAVGGLNAGAGDISLNAVAGGITDSGDVAADLVGDEVRLTAGTAIGAGNNALEISGNEVAARAAGGGLFLRELTSVAVDSVSQVPARRVQVDGSSINEQDTAVLNGLTTTASNGSVVLTAANGNITVNQAVTAHGSGNILLRADAQFQVPVDKDISLAAPVSSTSGHISLLAARGILQGAAGDVTSGGGTIELEAGDGSLTMSDGALIQSLAGVIRLLAFDDVALGGVDAGLGSVAVVAVLGGITDAGDAHREISAAQAQLISGSNAGMGANTLEIAVNLLAAHVLGGGLFVLNDAALTVDTVGPVTVNRVDSDGSTPVVLRQTEIIRSDLVVGGHLVLRTLAGSITINDGVNGDSLGLSVAGNALIQAQGATANIQLNATAIVSGNVSIMAGRSVFQAAAGDIAIATGSLDIAAQTGAISMADGAYSLTGGGNIRYHAPTDITLGGLNAGLGQVSVVADSGTILDAGNFHPEIQAASARLSAGQGIGGGSDHLEITVGRAAARAAGGGIFLTSAGAITVDTVGPVIINRVDLDGTAPVSLRQTDAALSDLVTTADNGAIVLRTQNGGIIINNGNAPDDDTGVRAHGAGNIRLETQTTSTNDKNIVLNATVRSTSGRISIIANGNFTQNAAGDIVTGAGSVDVEALNGSVLMADGAVTQTANATIRYQAADSLTIGSLNNGAGDISLIAGGSILDGGDTDLDVQSARLRVVSGNAIGAGTNHLDTAIVTLAGRAGAGGIFITDADAITVDALGAMVTSRVAADGTAPVAARMTDAVLSEVRTTASGAIVLAAANGSLMVNQAIAASGVGNIRLLGLSADLDEMDVLINATVESGSGHITIFASRHVTQSVTGSISTQGGSVNVDASTGNITMANGAVASTASGNIRYFAANNVLLGGLNAGSGAISITAATGSITDNGDTHKDLAASQVRLIAGIGIGAPTNPLDIAVNVLAARAAGGGIFIVEDDALVVDVVGPLATSRVRSDGTAPLNLRAMEPAISDVRTIAGNGGIVLQTLNGSITINDGTALADGCGLLAHGSGNILLEAQTTGANDKDIALNSGVVSGAGMISIIADRHILQSSFAVVSTSGTGTIEIEARRGSVSMHSGAIVETSGGNIRLKSSQSIAVAALDAGAGNVSLVASTGSITDAGGVQINITANNLRLLAGLSISTLRTNVVLVAAQAGAGSLSLLETDDLAVGTVSVAVNRVTANAETIIVTDSAQGDLVTLGGNGSIILRTLAGSITLAQGSAATNYRAISAQGSGNVLVSANGAASQVILDPAAVVASGSGHITLAAGQTIILGAGAGLLTGGGGTVNVEADTGDVVMHGEAFVTAGGGDVRLLAGLGVAVGAVSTMGNVSLIAVAGSVTDAGVAGVNVIANQLRLIGTVGVGSQGATFRPLKTSVSVISAQANNGGINLLESDALTVGDTAATIQKVQTNGSVQAVTDAVQSDLVTNAGDGSVLVRTVAGTLTLNDGAAGLAGSAVSAYGTGNIALRAGGETSDLVLNSDVISSGGHLTLVAGRGLSAAANADVLTGGMGTVYLEALGGGISMHDTSRFAAGDGDVRLRALTDVLLGGIATAGNVSLITTVGAVLDGGDSRVDVAANQLRVAAGTGFGRLGTGADAVETSINIFSARVGGGINLLEVNDLVVDDALVTVQRVEADGALNPITDSVQPDVVTTAANGAIVLRVLNGNLSLNDGNVPNDIAVRADGSGNILLQAEGIGGDILNQAGIQSTSGHITLSASRNAALSSGAHLTTSGMGSIILEAGTGGVIMNDNSRLSASAAVRISAATVIWLGGVQTTGDVSLVAGDSVRDAGDTYLDVSAAGLRMVAGSAIGGVGAGGDALEIRVATVSARAAGGGVHLIESDNLAVDSVVVVAQKVGADAAATTVTDAAQSDVTTTGGDGSIVIELLAGSLTLNDGAVSEPGQAIRAQGLGHVGLWINGDLIANARAAVLSEGGHLTVNASGLVNFASGADLGTSDAGCIMVSALAGNLTMADNTLMLSDSGSIRLFAAGNVIVGGLETGGAVSVIAENGSILDAGDAYHDITAAGLRIVAGNGIGLLTGGNAALETRISTLAARVGAGGVSLLESDALQVGEVLVSGQFVQRDATLAAWQDEALSDVISSIGGKVVLRTTNGALTLNDGDAFPDGVAVNAGDSILLQAGGVNSDVVVNASAISTSGSVTVLAGRDVVLEVFASLGIGGSGNLNVEAAAGSILMNALSGMTAATGAIRLAAAQNTIVAGISTAGHVSITATNGSILDGGDAAPDISANGLRLAAGQGIGTLGAIGNSLETAAVTLSAQAGAGGINIFEQNALVVDTVAVAVQKVQNNGAVFTISDVAQTGVTTLSGNGGIVLRNLTGSLVVRGATTANGAGNVLLAATGASADLEISADVSSDRGNISLIAGRKLSLNGSAGVRTSGGSLDLEAGAGAIVMAEAAVLQSDGGNMRLSAAMDVLISRLDARTASDRAANTLGSQAAWGGISITAAGGAIREASLANVSASLMGNAVRLQAASAIGGFTASTDVTFRLQSTSNLTAWTDLTTVTGSLTQFSYTDASPATGMRFYRVVSSDPNVIAAMSYPVMQSNGAVRLEWRRVDLAGVSGPVKVEAATLAASAGQGGINLLESTSLMVTSVSVAVRRVASDGSSNVLAAQTASDLITSANGAIALRSVNGGLALDAGGADGLAISADGTGSILLAAGGPEADLQANAAIRSGIGSVSIQGGRHVSVAAVIAIATSGAGTIEMEAAAGSISMAADSRIETAGGNIRLLANQNITLGVVDARTTADRAANTLAAQAAWGSVSVAATNGSITDADTTAAKAVNLFANAARLRAGISVGNQSPAVNALETELRTIAILARGGGLNILDMTDLTVGTVGVVPANRVATNGTSSTLADAASLTGAIKFGSAASISSELAVPIGNYPAFTVLNTLSAQSLPNQHTGLYEQVIRISNPTGSTIDAVRIYLRNLPAGARVPYAAGTENGIPYVQYNRPLGANQTQDVTIEYFAPSAGDIPANVNFLPVVNLPMSEVNITQGTTINVAISRLPDLHYLLVFNTLANRNYYIQYSDNGTDWFTVRAPVIGTGSTMFWLDNGPAKTYPDSDEVGVRNYRVILL